MGDNNNSKCHSFNHPFRLHRAAGKPDRGHGIPINERRMPEKSGQHTVLASISGGHVFVCAI